MVDVKVSIERDGYKEVWYIRDMKLVWYHSMLATLRAYQDAYDETHIRLRREGAKAERAEMRRKHGRPH